MKEAETYLNNADQAAREKIYRNMKRVENGESDTRIFKKLTGDIWEIRAESGGNQHRLLAFWDTRRQALIVATHGFGKKTQKTPPKEIRRAEKLREEYFKD